MNSSEYGKKLLADYRFKKQQGAVRLNTKVLEHAQKTVDHSAYIHNPEKWFKDKLGLHIYSKQREILKSVAKNKRTLVAACVAAGKSVLAAAYVLWYCNTRPPEDAYVIILAPSIDQIRDVIFRYMNALMVLARKRGTPLKGQLLANHEYKIDGTVVAVGANPADPENAIQGRHASPGKESNVLVVIDEAVGVSKRVYDMVTFITTGKDDRVLAIFNPTKIGGGAYIEYTRKKNHIEQNKHRPKERQTPDPFPSTNIIKISYLDCPNFSGEKGLPEDVYRNTISQSIIDEELAKAHGDEESADFMGRILAEFPDSDTDSLFKYSSIDNALDRGYQVNQPETEDDHEYIKTLRKHKRGDTKRAIFGVDVGRKTDRTVIYLRQGLWFQRLAVIRTDSTLEIAEQIAKQALIYRPAEIRIEVMEAGIGVYETLQRWGYPVVALVPQAKASASSWANARSEWWSHFSRMIATQPIGIDPADTSIAEELKNMRIDQTRSDVFAIESKKAYRVRTGNSPDNADAACFAALPASVDVFQGVYGKNEEEYDLAYKPDSGEAANPAKITKNPYAGSSPNISMKLAQIKSIRSLVGR